jgi:lambda repressor-like predicted transcriptional regulator
MAGGRARERPNELAPTPWPARPSTDPHAEVARRFVVALQRAVGDRSVRSVAVAAGMSHGSLNRVLAGSVWPDLLTIAKLEGALGADLWPGRLEP